MNYLTRLKELRQERNVTQKDMADLLEMGVRSYQHYELGEREPNIEKLIKLANYFNVSLDYLVGLSDNPERNE